ncbi:MAG: RAD55 family ATPase, partial [Candidatus Nanohaloarchaeota archaeon QJJ-5]|nr:RAD55 family ATPase [Candidatus Nanohaloarchaeota archaeon QJJ-5]
MTSTRLSLGDPILNRMLNGGIPSNRTTLITGAAGTGKSTLAMQFLQEGLQNGEDCLYISTEQTPAEIQDAFSDFSFNLDH